MPEIFGNTPRFKPAPMPASLPPNRRYPENGHKQQELEQGRQASRQLADRLRQLQADSEAQLSLLRHQLDIASSELRTERQASQQLRAENSCLKQQVTDADGQLEALAREKELAEQRLEERIQTDSHKVAEAYSSRDARAQQSADLMAELAKIVRVIRKRDPEAPHNTLLVLDASTGQNALSQVEIFRKIADVTGLVMTKLDGTAKGGVLVALADRFGLPIHAIGVGEGIDDLAPFDPDDFARALTGLEEA